MIQYCKLYINRGGKKMKKLLPIFVAVFFIISCYGASAGSMFEINKSIEWKTSEVLCLFGSDELDQYQPEMNFFAPVGPVFLAPDINYMSAQSFIPTKNVLTRVELMAGKNSTTTYDFNLAIRDDLLGADLTSISLSPTAFPTENFSWVEFDFEDISVTPGNTYFIVAYTTDSPDNWYAWGAMLLDVYPHGMVWLSEDEGSSWENDTNVDCTFATYGLNNTAPSAPSITGPDSGKTGKEYDYMLKSIDNEGDDVYYYIDWGDGTFQDWDGPYGSEMDVIFSHSWNEEGTYTIKAKAKDAYNAEGNWTEFEVNIPRSRQVFYNFNVFDWLFEHFPNAFSLMKYLLGF
jgi:hypothetical protein